MRVLPCDLIAARRARSRPALASALSMSKLPSTSSSALDMFLSKVARLPPNRTSMGRGRLLFAMDATASREPTWDHACTIQGEMFVAAEALGGLDVRLAFYRGFDEFK